MKRLLCFSLMVTAGLTHASSLLYGFDTSNEGWRRSDFNPATFVLTDLGAATWNPAGNIEANDFSNYAFHLSPDFTGDFSGSTRVEFDYSTADSEATPAPLIVLHGSNGTAIYQNAVVPADGLYHHYSYDISVGQGWQFGDGVNFRTATATDISSVLSNLYQIGVSADMNDGADFSRLDNVALVPEPASMVALGLGAMALGRRRRNQG